MNSAQLSQITTIKSDLRQPSAMFSLSESEHHYWIAVDIPTLPTCETEILRTRDELIVEGLMRGSEEKQTVFRCLPNGRGLKAAYKEGVLWILLPKVMALSN